MAAGWQGKPNPGSDEAVDLGCKCPRMDNNHGKWAPWGEDGWWIIESCPLHGSVANETGVDARPPSPKVN